MTPRFARDEYRKQKIKKYRLTMAKDATLLLIANAEKSGQAKRSECFVGCRDIKPSLARAVAVQGMELWWGGDDGGEGTTGATMRGLTSE